jgi:hypothetical protein
LRLIVFIALSIFYYNVQAQTLGGEASYSFLKLPASAMQSAAGGVNVSMLSKDVGLSAHNPALLDQTQHSLLAASFNAFFKGTKAFTVNGAYYVPKLKTTFGGQIFFIDYGSIPLTDAAGNEEGVFRPVDFSLQLSASKTYAERWHYGGTVKYVHSNYGMYKSSALMADFGLLYNDSNRLFRAGLVAKNMGVQLKVYNSAEDLPFDLQIGITKRLSKAPFGFSLTAQQVHQFNTLYSDTLYNRDARVEAKSGFGSKLFNHFVGALHIYAGNSLDFSVGYNRLRRNELNNGTAGNGLNGFSGGFTATFPKIGISYARSYYGRSFAYNQLGIQINLSKLNVLQNL